jgi:hypothetical protein
MADGGGRHLRLGFSSKQADGATPEDASEPVISVEIPRPLR